MIFDLDFRKFVQLLLPIRMRKDLLVQFLYSAVLPIRQLHSNFMNNREDNLYRLTHNGQVCYLRSALNDAFPYRSVDFEIEDNYVTSEWIYAKSEVAFPYDQLIINEDPEGVVLWDERYVLIETTPFLVKCPPEIYVDQDSMNRVRHLINQYKILSKQATYASL